MQKFLILRLSHLQVYFFIWLYAHKKNCNLIVLIARIFQKLTSLKFTHALKNVNNENVFVFNVLTMYNILYTQCATETQ